MVIRVRRRVCDRRILLYCILDSMIFFFQAEDGIRDLTVTGVQTCALPISMAKFVFRSLAREHPEPSDFLAAANDVVAEEIAPGKFITMVYLAVDTANGEVEIGRARVGKECRSRWSPYH